MLYVNNYRSLTQHKIFQKESTHARLTRNGAVWFGSFLFEKMMKICSKMKILNEFRSFPSVKICTNVS